MKNLDPKARIVFIFAFAFAALLLLVMASQVGMPMRAILLAIVVSDLILLIVIGFGDKLPNKRR